MPQITEPDKIPYVGFMRSDSPYTSRTLTNPLTEDFTFMWDGKEYKIKAGHTEVYPEFLAFHGASRMAKYYFSKKNAPKDPKLSIVLYNERSIEEFTSKVIDAPVVADQPSVSRAKSSGKRKPIVVEEAPVLDEEPIEDTAEVLVSDPVFETEEEEIDDGEGI